MDDGYVEMFRVLRDVPLEEHSHEEVTFWGPLAGRSPALTRRLLMHVRDLDLSHLDPTAPQASDVDVVAAAFGAQIDLWDVILRHKEVWVVLCLLIMGLLQWWNSPVIVVTAAKGQTLQ